MTPLVLSLFPGIGLLDRGFEDEGFCVVRGPDLLWGGDIRRFSPPAGRFEGVIGGPPCQAFSRMRHMVEANGYTVAENLIPEFERCVAEATPDWFVMENVPAAPLPEIPGYEVQSLFLNNRWFGGEQNRERRISFGSRRGLRIHPQPEALVPAASSQAVLASGSGRSVPVAIGGSGKLKESRRCRAADLKSEAGFREAVRLQGLPDDFDLPPFTVTGKIRAVGNGVPYPLARAIAKAVALSIQTPAEAGRR